MWRDYSDRETPRTKADEFQQPVLDVGKMLETFVSFQIDVQSNQRDRHP
jgi:hypothetical protein